jgi:hypothetical protein
LNTITSSELRNDEINNLYSSPDITRLIKSKKMSLMVQTACAGKCAIHAILASKTLAAIHHPWYLGGGGIKILQDQKCVHLEYTNIPKVLYIPQHKGHCCTNHGCALVILAL